MLFHHVALYTNKLDDMVVFYCDVFGFAIDKRFFRENTLTGVHLKRSNIIIELLCGESVPSSIHLAFSVNSTMLFYETNCTLSYESTPFVIGDETVVFLRDPSGYRIEINDRL